jgi:hypothetical protein|tara:strand:- start:27 stop:731 length:705 start_codon:yes stop_codon:yes gene_type:complete
MAERPVFIVNSDNTESVNYLTKDVNFKWYPGYSMVQKRKSILSLHENANFDRVFKILEVSSKSENTLGVWLSAFNLKVHVVGVGIIPLECAYQGAKVFEFGGPYVDLFEKSPFKIKKDERLRNSGVIKSFEFNGKLFDNIPTTYFYNWLYINALHENREFSKEVINFDAFTDIEFNPKRSKNCQAKACALYVSLFKKGYLNFCLNNPDKFKEIMKSIDGVDTSGVLNAQFSLGF